MQVRKAVMGSVIGVGLGAAVFAGAGAASADVSHPSKPSGGDVTSTVTKNIHSFNTITKTYDDHSVNLFNGVNVLSGNTTNISNKFLNNLGSGANIANTSVNLHNALKVWTKVGNGNTASAPIVNPLAH